MEAVTLQGVALPFGERVNDLRVTALLFDIKGHRALHAVEVVIQTALRTHKMRCGHAHQMQVLAEPLLKIVSRLFDRCLRLTDRER